MTVTDLPAVDASLNFVSTVFITTGWYLIRRGHWRSHIACMITAVISSSLFLGCYLTYHYYTGEKSTHFSAGGAIAAFYFTMLISHIILAAVILPFVLFTAYRGLTGEYEKHRKLSRITWTIWLYVSITGVLVYLLISPFYTHS